MRSKRADNCGRIFSVTKSRIFLFFLLVIAFCWVSHNCRHFVGQRKVVVVGEIWHLPVGKTIEKPLQVLVRIESVGHGCLHERMHCACDNRSLLGICEERVLSLNFQGLDVFGFCGLSYYGSRGLKRTTLEQLKDTALSR